MNRVILYHKDCRDGFGAAWVAWTRFGDEATYIPVQYQQNPSEQLFEQIRQADDLYILDFSYSRKVIEKLAEGRSLQVIDHHVTAQKDLEGLPYVFFDMSKSGAVLTWEFFYPEKQVPGLLLYIQDRDLWKWELPQSREFSTALEMEPYDFKRWSWLAEEFTGVARPPFWMVDRGTSVLMFKNQIVTNLCQHASYRGVEDYKVPSVCSSVFQSEIGEKLIELYPDAPFVAIFFTDSEDKVIWSLRSRGDFHVGDLARRLGGGGHRNAAGFRVSGDRTGLARVILNRNRANEDCVCSYCVQLKDESQDSFLCETCGYHGRPVTDRCTCRESQCVGGPDQTGMGCSHGYLACPVCDGYSAEDRDGWDVVRELRRVLEET